VPETAVACTGCGTAFPVSALSCPSCHTLLYAAKLTELSQRAMAQEQASDIAGAIATWRDALRLLPAESQQAAAISSHISRLTPQINTEQQKTAVPGWAKKFGSAGAVAAAFLGKAKFLLLGLGKLKMLLGMAASLGLYWSLWGWKFAAGFILTIYIHEMGHVWAMRKFGLRASTPMFIPGFGAFISLYDSPADEHQDAQIGLAGPMWGAGAALGSWALYFLTRNEIFLAVANATAWMNLFNLTPVWSLDGSRGFRALDCNFRIAIAILTAALWFSTNEGMFLIVLLGTLYRLFWKKDFAPRPDYWAIGHFAGLLVLFAAIIVLTRVGPLQP
jgi:Zn-dependent protease